MTLMWNDSELSFLALNLCYVQLHRHLVLPPCMDLFLLHLIRTKEFLLPS